MQTSLPGGETILIVDDHDLVFSTPKNMSDGRGYRVLAARNGREALEILGQDREVDLLFTDLLMPDGHAWP